MNHNYYLLIDLGSDSGYGCPQAFAAGQSSGLAIRAPNNSAGGGAPGHGCRVLTEFPEKAVEIRWQNGANQIYFRVNPDIGVVGYTNVALYVNSDTIFRSPMEDLSLTLDVCTVTPIAQGC